MSQTPLTEEMITTCPAADIHVHVPGTIAPLTAWQLGIRGGFIEVYEEARGLWRWRDGKKAIGANDPHKKYSNIFCGKGGVEVQLGPDGIPLDLAYNFNFVGGGADVFTGFDAVMATVQGHRHRPGGIETPGDYAFVMEEYLGSCLKQNIRYTQAAQNITIAQVLYPAASPKEARAQFFRLCAQIVASFAAQGVALRFYHCANKTSASGLPGGMQERAQEWVVQILESGGVFAGLSSAGHEQREQDEGGPEAMKAAYARAEANGIGSEAHAGEGIGVEHLMRTIRMLPAPRPPRSRKVIAHGVQVIESAAAISEAKANNVTFAMIPCINVALATPLHVKEENGRRAPHAKLLPDGTRDPSVLTAHIHRLEDHPFFPLQREHGLTIALASDNPEMGGVPYKEQVRLLAKLPEPLAAEELLLSNLNAIEAAFCGEKTRGAYVKELKQWMTRYRIAVAHRLLT